MENAKLTIKVSLGKTINIGNYESLRVDVSAEEQFPSLTSYDDAFTKVYDYVADRLEEKIEDVRKRFSR